MIPKTSHRSHFKNHYPQWTLLLILISTLSELGHNHGTVQGFVTPGPRTIANRRSFSPGALSDEVIAVAENLWGGASELRSLLPNDRQPTSSGEADLPSGIPYSERATLWEDRAIRGNAQAQHSLGLLQWSGFGNVSKNPTSSAKWNAAAAAQNHLDAMVVLGGCLRKGSGVPQNVDLGVRLINHSADRGNPTGVNKCAAMLESQGDWDGAVELYEKSVSFGNANALLLFNLGWCLVNGEGVEKDVKSREGL